MYRPAVSFASGCHRRQSGRRSAGRSTRVDGSRLFSLFRRMARLSRHTTTSIRAEVHPEKSCDTREDHDRHRGSRRTCRGFRSLTARRRKPLARRHIKPAGRSPNITTDRLHGARTCGSSRYCLSPGAAGRATAPAGEDHRHQLRTGVTGYHLSGGAPLRAGNFTGGPATGHCLDLPELEDPDFLFRPSGIHPREPVPGRYKAAKTVT
jgi:hypothetical protein